MTKNEEWEVPVIISSDFSLVPDLVNLRKALHELDCYLPLDEMEFGEDDAVYATIYGSCDTSEFERVLKDFDKVRIDYDALKLLGEEVDE